MADELKRKISDLTRATEVNAESLLLTSIPDSSAESGFTSKAAPVSVLSEGILGGINYETELETEDKTVFGGINENSRKISALQSIVEGIKVEFQKNHAEGNFTFRSGVIGSILQALGGHSRKSKNLVNINTALENEYNAVSINGNEITVSTKVNGTYRGSEIRNVYLKRNTQYTIRATVKEVSTVGSIGVRYWDGSTYVATLVASTPQVTSAGVIERTFTTRSDADRYQIFLFSTWGTSASGRTVYSDIQLEEGSTATDYEPYFEGLKDSAVTKFTVKGKNLAFVSEISAMSNVYFECENMQKNVIHTVSFVGRSSFNFNVQLRNRSGAIIATLAQGKSMTNGAKYELSFTPTEDDLRIVLNNYNGAINLDSFQIERGSVATSFAPYVEPKEYPITFNGKSAGSIRDEVDLPTKKKFVRVGSVDLGTLNWGKVSGNVYAIVLNIPHNGNGLLPIYEKTGIVGVTSMADQTYQIRGKADGYDGAIYVRDDRYTDATSFKSAMQGVILNYELAEPVIEDIEESEVMAIVNAGDSVTFDSEVPVGSDWNDLVFLKGV